MASDEHVALLKQGVAAWNAWRDQSPDIRPDLTKANLANSTIGSSSLNDAKLSRANLQGAVITSSDLDSVVWNKTICPDGTSTGKDVPSCSGHGL